MANYNLHKLTVWCGVIFFLLLTLGYALIPWFELVPPLAPGLTKAEALRIIDENRTALKIGQTIIFNFNLFLIPWSAGLAAQLRRMERNSPVMSDVARHSATVVAVSGALPSAFFLAVLYRPDIDPDIAYILLDVYWIFFVGWVGPFFFLSGSVGVTILSYSGKHVIYPRWFGFWSLWQCVLVFGGLFIIFVYHGPFAWDGLIAFWVPISTLMPWIATATVLTYMSILRQEKAESEYSTLVE